MVGRQVVSSVSATPTLSNQLVNGGCNVMSIRNKVRNYFPRPNEVMRIRKQGWKARMATLSGRKTIMRRILKGRHVLTH